MSPMRVLVYEHLSAGGLPDEPSLLVEGAAMLAAVLDDLAALPGVRPVVVQTRSGVGPAAAACDAALVIAPEFDDILASLAYLFETLPCRLLGPDGDAVRLTADKLVLAEHLRRAGVPTPVTALVPGVVVKPRHGAGCQTTYHLPGEFVAQPFVPGDAVSVAFIDGVPLRACSQQIVEEGGRLTYRGGGLPVAPDLEGRAVALAARAVAAVPGLSGYYGVDLVLGPAGDFVIEINPRLTTSYLGLRALCHNNLMAVLLGRDHSPLRWRGGAVAFDPGGTLTRREDS
ncbi:MAG: ATP-grasp domain-containing protein [Gemmataceae bacterium]